MNALKPSSPALIAAELPGIVATPKTSRTAAAVAVGVGHYARLRLQHTVSSQAGSIANVVASHGRAKCSAMSGQF